MRQRLRTTLLAILALASTRVAVAQQPQPAGGAGAPGAPAAKTATAPQRPAILNQVLGTVNNQPITRLDFINFISRTPLPPGENKEIYQVAMDYLVNFKLVSEYFVKQRTAVTSKDLDDEIAGIERKMKAEDGRDLKTALAEAGITEKELRTQLTPQVAMRKFATSVTDADLKKFIEANKDVFDRVLVKASHIVVLVKPGATPAEKEAAKQKLAGIKREIESGKISFADAANKYSEDEANKQSPNGGDLGYFPRKGQYDEVFASKAFSSKLQMVSEPFETPYGFHLVQVTDRKPPQPFDFEQNRNTVLNQYMVDLQERIVVEERKKAKIDIKPMPADLFPPAQPATAPVTKDAGKGAATKPAAPR
jgi:peptidyl-prolyl cis-trans isomerase C